jgi:uncharacterized HAD superfamily protein
VSKKPFKPTYCFDIDGTICTDTKGEYTRARPHYKAIAKVNRLYRQRHKIILFTARGSLTGIDWRQVTKQQLKKWGVKYHQLLFGKPPADIFIDDKAVSAVDFFAR